MRNLVIISIAAVWFVSCSPISRNSLSKTFRETDNTFQDHTGFALYDLEKKKWVYEYKSAHYFTPASNTKIFTLFSCLALLGDSVPGLRYTLENDSLIFWGTGDPSFLYKEVYDNGRVYNFLKSSASPLYFSESNYHTTNFGSGWAWDDYNDYYSAERYAFPIYGNLLSIEWNRPRMLIQPPYFKNYVKTGSPERKAKLVRRPDANEYTFHPDVASKEFKASVPFKVASELNANLLSDTLRKIVRVIQKQPSAKAKTLYSLPVDSLYRVMMQESDNFIAEQLLLICSQLISDTLKPEIAIAHIKKNYLSDLTDEPQWVDGSGLSRYNLFTPRSIVQLWEKIYNRMPRERLFAILAIGGRSGTIKRWYSAEPPFIFGKTGSLSNNHCLSGYLITKKGKTLIFSFMNNNFTSSVNDIRGNMDKILRVIYERY
jgi:D-alanyl-D-alanine carboxypeptidase/D-alanyl-D-alanine-endopeptidase (penicillin-binding protein 4)